MNNDPEAIEAEFQSLIKDLPDPSTDDTFSLIDINECVISLTDCASFLSRWISRYMEDDAILYPGDAIHFTKAVAEMADALSTIMEEAQNCDCEECELEDDEDDS